MILILSKNTNEVTTEKVIDWLEYYKANYLRLNGDDFYRNVVLREGNFEFTNLDINKVNIVWTRRWLDENHIGNLLDDSSLSNKNYIRLYSNLMRDLNYLRKTFQRSLSDKQWITKPEELQVYKYHQLDVAESVGLKIPKTLTTNLKSELKNFILENKRVITKSISDPTSFYSYVEGSPQVSMMRTIEVDSEVLKNVKDTFFPSLFQELINKKIELRVFYLDRKFYSMAIFSQLDEQTTIDFRNYNDETPNRTVPFKLPLEIKEKLQKFIDHFNFTTGSFDLIYTDKNEFVFLEINQVGQFGMTSFPTNYDLEKILAKHLITIDEREQHKI